MVERLDDKLVLIREEMILPNVNRISSELPVEVRHYGPHQVFSKLRPIPVAGHIWTIDDFYNNKQVFESPRNTEPYIYVIGDCGDGIVPPNEAVNEIVKARNYFPNAILIAWQHRLYEQFFRDVGANDFLEHDYNSKDSNDKLISKLEEYTGRRKVSS